MHILHHLNYVHILVASLAYFMLGFLWYGLIFGKQWTALMGMSTTPTDADKKRMPMMMVMTVVYNFLTTFTVAAVLYFVAPANILQAIEATLLVSVGFTAVPMALNYMYAKRPFIIFS